MWNCLQLSVRHGLMRTVEASIQSNLARTVHTSSVLFAEPLKKKKRMDPVLLKLRVDRKIRKLEKAIRQLENAEKVLKPLMEQTLAPHVYREIDLRVRNPEMLQQLKDQMDKLLRVWSVYRKEVAEQQQKSIDRMTAAQQRVIDELRNNWPQLYEHAISIDQSLLPYEETHVITDSPPNPSYVPPDGSRTDVTKQWVM